MSLLDHVLQVGRGPKGESLAAAPIQVGEAGVDGLSGRLRANAGQASRTALMGLKKKRLGPQTRPLTAAVKRLY